MTIINEIEWSWRKVSPDAVQMDQRFQPRVKGVFPATGQQIRLGYEARRPIPPAHPVGRVGQGLYVLDGFHRLEAARQAGITEISARVAPMREETAVWVAVEANAIHGLKPERKGQAALF
jgi:hypothetical protein